MGGSLMFQRLGAVSPAPTPSVASASTADMEDAAAFFPTSPIDWKALREESPECVAWLSIDGVIDLPVMQADPDDPDYYLAHDRFGNANVYGCPYLDAACGAAGFASGNAIVFGHHMPDGTMFSPLDAYLDPDTAEQHSQLVLQTPLLDTLYEICLVAEAPADTPLYRTSFESADDFRAWLHEVADAASVEIDAARWLDASTTRTLTLATCHPTDNDTRILIFTVPVCSAQATIEQASFPRRITVQNGASQEKGMGYG